jgi:transcriptional regulator GlxA family with amidase domain
LPYAWPFIVGKEKCTVSRVAQLLNSESAPVDFGFLLIPQFSMLAFSGVLEPLRMANRLAGRELYRWWLLSADDTPVEASNCMKFTPTARLDEGPRMDTLITVASIDTGDYCTPQLLQWLRQMALHGVNIGATSTAALILARAGLLDGYRCTIHWENLESFREEFPNVNATAELYEIDGKRLTCSGGSAGLDMMMHLIALRHGHALAAGVAEQCIHPEIRKSQASQRLSLRSRLNVCNAPLFNAIDCMERHLEDTLDCAQIASQIGLSERHMSRLFQSQLSTTPARFYLNLRLDRARALLQQTVMSVLEVGVACGFASSSHFIRCYRARYGHTPAAEHDHGRRPVPGKP